ncbi:Thymidylate kinase [Candidatus Paraburkholderia calva]|nr:Thymidylate kinase [Candidatus Paraburkholderia calva]
MRFQEERFEYTGAGGELFKGFVSACVVLIGSGVAAGVVQAILVRTTDRPLLGTLPMLAFLLLLGIWKAGAHYYGAERYRLSARCGRGIHGGMTGSAMAYGVRTVCYYALCLLSLLQLARWAAMRLAERRINTASFGSGVFRFEGKAMCVYGPYLLSLLGHAVLLGFIYVSFMKPVFVLFGELHAMHCKGVSAALKLAIYGNLLGAYVSFIAGAWFVKSMYLVTLVRHVAGNTRFGGVLTFSVCLSLGGWLRLVSGNLLILVCTLGLGYPVALQRSLRFVANTLRAQGYVDPAELKQNTLCEPTMGEGMLNLIDHGSAL